MPPLPSPADAVATVRSLYERHGDFVWRAAARMGVAEHEREDVVHDVFVVVHRRLGDYEGRSAITTWLYGIVRGVTRNLRRRDNRRMHLRALVPQSPITSEDPRATEAFARFIASLEPERREVFALAEVEGMSGPEIAQALEINLNTVYTRLRAAKKAFRAFAAAELGHDDAGVADG